MVTDFVARKHKRVPVTYEIAQLEPILSTTYGVILYQEQVMRIASDIAGFTMGQADVLRRAMGKKKHSEMAKQKALFIEGAVKNKINRTKAEHLFDLCEKFAGYGFNRSHSTCYAVISYQTAYLKANYGIEFMAGLLTSVTGNADKVSDYIQESQRMGIDVLAPEINESLVDFTVVVAGIRFGLVAVKNVGAAPAEHIVTLRSGSGSFKSFADFLNRADLRLVNKRVIESLIKSGAFDSFGFKRAYLLKNLEREVERAQKIQAQMSSGQEALFEMPANLRPASVLAEGAQDMLEEFSPEELLRLEKEMLGLYISRHPLTHLKELLESQVKETISQIYSKKEGVLVTAGGMLTSLRRITTRRNELMLIGALEDLTGRMPMVVFPKAFERFSSYLVEDAVLIIKGRLDNRNEEFQIIVEEVRPLEEKAMQRRTLHIQMPSRSPIDFVGQIKGVLELNQGSEPVFLHMDEKTVQIGRKYWINIHEGLISQVESLVGEGTAWVEMM
jgi:DNA polymerase-3 subunit alpha